MHCYDVIMVTRTTVDTKSCTKALNQAVALDIN